MDFVVGYYTPGVTKYINVSCQDTICPRGIIPPLPPPGGGRGGRGGVRRTSREPHDHTPVYYGNVSPIRNALRLLCHGKIVMDFVLQRIAAMVASPSLPPL